MGIKCSVSCKNWFNCKSQWCGKDTIKENLENSTPALWLVKTLEYSKRRKPYWQQISICTIESDNTSSDSWPEMQNHVWLLREGCQSYKHPGTLCTHLVALWCLIPFVVSVFLLCATICGFICSWRTELGHLRALFIHPIPFIFSMCLQGLEVSIIIVLSPQIE